VQLLALQLVIEPARLAAVLLAGLPAQPAAAAQRAQRVPFLGRDQVVTDVGVGDGDEAGRLVPAGEPPQQGAENEQRQSSQRELEGVVGREEGGIPEEVERPGEEKASHGHCHADTEWFPRPGEEVAHTDRGDRGEQGVAP
jgi:hypothetical protein